MGLSCHLWQRQAYASCGASGEVECAVEHGRLQGIIKLFHGVT
jgi:hypothetical protein